MFILYTFISNFILHLLDINGGGGGEEAVKADDGGGGGWRGIQLKKVLESGWR